MMRAHSSHSFRPRVPILRRLPRGRCLLILALPLLVLALPVGATPPTAPPASAPHLARLGVDRWHLAGCRGQGVKVAILDSGFRGYRDHLGSSLPSKVTVRSFRHDGNLEAKDSQHGILCGEVIHALAPEAELLFANWEPEHPDRFLDAVRWACDQGASLISCSVIMPSWSDGEGGGRVHEQLAELVGENRLFFACAGNTAERHWAGPFQEGGDGYHAWRTGRTDNRLSPWGKDRVSVELCAPAGSVYELSVCERDTAREIGRCLAQSGQGKACAVVHVEPRDGRVYVVRVRHRAGVPSPFHVVALGAGLEEAVARGSIPFPADGPAVVAVGAVNEGGLRQLYSSCGPNSRRPKPDLVAPVPFPSSVRARPFGGTSAAAPQAAALAALWWSRHPEWSANQVRTTLTDTARDLGPRGHDFETGYGMIGLPWQRLAALEEKLGTR